LVAGSAVLFYYLFLDFPMARLTRKQKIQQERPISERKYFENKQLFARNNKQEDALDSLRNNTLTIMTGPPGSAKSLMAVYVACEMLDNREIDKIYYVKPMVNIPGSAGIGFLPGDEKEKTQPHIAPVKDCLEVFMPKQKAEYLLDKKVIEFLPIEYLRGRSLNNCFVIADEMQSALPHNVMTILTRIGSNSKVALIGDVVQRDLDMKFGKLDGLTDATNRLKTLTDVSHVEFGFDDVCRSGFVKSVIYRYADLY
jgi:phosphate starvation-inducible PhoH-like protein